MQFPADSNMLLWYILISVLLVGLFIGIGYAYFKILKKNRRKTTKKDDKPFEAVESLGK